MKKWLSALIVIIFAASSLMPFSFKKVKAESVGGNSPIIGVNISVLDYDTDHWTVLQSADTEQIMWRCQSASTSTGCSVWRSENINSQVLDTITFNNITYQNTDRVMKYEFVLDKHYVGTVTLSSSVGGSTTKTYYVNGTSFELSSTQFISTFTVNSYNLKYAPEEYVDKARQWNVEPESLPIMFDFMDLYESGRIELYDFATNNYLTYPIFKVPNGEVVCKVWPDNTIGKFIFISNPEVTYGTVNRRFSYTSEYNETVDVEFVELGSWIGGYKLGMININTSNKNVGEVTITNTNGSNMYISPIFFGREGFINVGTDFAIRYGLSNKLLDNIQIIANGTASSNTSASDLEDNNDQMASDMNDMANVENQYNQDFNNQLDNIDFTNPVQQNAGILPAATFVISIFNGLINNNPLSMLIIVCCILLIGKKVIGK